MGTVGNFNSHKKLMPFTEMNPSVSQSGQFVGISRLSKRDNRHLRRAIYLMTASAVSKNAWFKAYSQERKAEGLSPQNTLFATTHKLIQVIFAMLSQRTCFNVKEAI
ncbi:MAG: transposase [bacterium]